MDLKSHLPTINILVGGTLTIAGAFRASIKDNESKREIISLQKNALNEITGGDSWCYLEEGFRERAGNVVPHGHIPLLHYILKNGCVRK